VISSTSARVLSGPRRKWGVGTDAFVLVEPDGGLGQSVIVGISEAADRGGSPEMDSVSPNLTLVYCDPASLWWMAPSIWRPCRDRSAAAWRVADLMLTKAPAKEAALQLGGAAGAGSKGGGGASGGTGGAAGAGSKGGGGASGGTGGASGGGATGALVGYGATGALVGYGATGALVAGGATREVVGGGATGGVVEGGAAGVVGGGATREVVGGGATGGVVEGGATGDVDRNIELATNTIRSPINTER